MRKSPRSTKVPQMYAAYELGSVPALANSSDPKSPVKGSPVRSPASKRRSRAAAKPTARTTRSQAQSKGTGRGAARGKGKGKGKAPAPRTRATGKRRRGSDGESAFADLVSLANETEAKSSHPGVQLLPEALVCYLSLSLVPAAPLSLPRAYLDRSNVAEY